MSTPHELEQLKRRLERLERELGETRRDFDVLERRVALDERLVASPPTAVAEAAPAQATPPPLPAFDAVPPSLPEPVVLATEEHVREPGGPPPLTMPVARPRFESVEPESAPVRDWLRRMQLWPPAADEGGAEARLGAWWATRVGMLLAVVGVVFFGVYVSLHTPPWVKFLELAAVALGVAGAGLWLERRVAGFGSVVFAGGLALFYFATYAGHALPGVRVFESLSIGVLAQTAAVALIVGAALWRRSAGVATLAIGLGYVTAFVSSRGGLDGYALGAALTLGVVAVVLRRWREWEGPSVVAMPAAYAIFVFGLEAVRAAEMVHLPVSRWVALAGLATLFFLRDWRGKPSEAGAVSTGEKIFQNANSSFALVCGLAAALGWARENLEVFYLVAAGWCATAAWLRSRQVRGGDAVAAVLTAKAAGAVTLAVIEVAGARSSALALLVQAWVMAWMARRLASGVLAVGTALVALVATAYFAAYGVQAVPLWSPVAAGAVVFALGLAALAVEGGRWLVADAYARRVLAIFGAGAGAWAFATAAANWSAAEWMPALWMGGAVLFALLAWARRSGSAGLAAGGLAVLASLGLWHKLLVESAPAFAGWNALAVIVPTLLAGCLPVVGRGRTAAWAIAAVGVSLTAFAVWPTDVALGALGLLAAGLVAASPRLREWHAPWLATLVAALAMWRWIALNGAMLEWAWIGFGAIWLLPVALRVVPAWDAVRRAERGAGWLEGAQVAVGSILAFAVIVEITKEGSDAVFAFAALAAATGLAAWLGRVAMAGWALGPLGVVLAGGAWLLAQDGGSDVPNPAFWAVLTAGVVVVALPLRPDGEDARGARRAARIASALGALAVLFTLFAVQRGGLAPYVTVGWGGVAILLFMAGLFRRAVSYRIIGLLALFPCVLRVFFVDLHSTLHRIAAFIALGLVFLWVGFSYHRFRHLLVPTPAERNPDSSSS